MPTPHSAPSAPTVSVRRTALAVLAGFVLWSLLWIGGGQVLTRALPDRFDANGATTDVGVLALLLGLSVVCSTLAGWATARLARRPDLLAARIQAGVLLLVGVGVQSAYWTLMPLWYHLVFLGLLAPATLIGARLARAGDAAR